MSDLVERLRKTAKMLMPHYPRDICTQAADRIEALEARNSSLVEQCETHAQQKMAAKNRIEALEAALRQIGDPLMPHQVDGVGRAWEQATIQTMQKIARAALEPEPDK